MLTLKDRNLTFKQQFEHLFQVKTEKSSPEQLENQFQDHQIT